MTYFDPYQGNILVVNLGDIKSRNDISAFLTYLPKLPPEKIEHIPRHIRLHLLQDVRDLHVPSLNEVRLAESLDLMLRQGYKYRDPKLSNTWQKIYSGSGNQNKIIAPPMVIGVVGIPGVGKTQTVKRDLLSYQQVITHEKFPTMMGQFNQVVWISVDVPSSGKTEHLAISLMNAWDQAMNSHLDSYIPRFYEAIQKNKLDGLRMLDEWQKIAASHFLGVLHLDEAQNLFSIPSLKKRNSINSKVDSPFKLSIKEDGCLKWILSLTNTWGIPIALSFSPDGIKALKSRFSNLQRLVSNGLHELKRFESYTDLEFQKVFLPSLFKYQYVKDKLQDIELVGKVLIQLSGGIQRIIIAIWIAAHRVAFERSDCDSLVINDFIDAAKLYLAPISPAINAINSGEPSKMAHYEDMIGDEEFWDSFWNAIFLEDINITKI